MPIKSITKESGGEKFTYNGGSDEPGEIIVKLLSTLKGIQQGKIEDTFGWLDRVQEPEGYGSTTPPNANGDNVDQLP